MNWTYVVTPVLGVLASLLFPGGGGVAATLIGLLFGAAAAGAITKYAHDNPGSAADNAVNLKLPSLGGDTVDPKKPKTAVQQGVEITKNVVEKTAEVTEGTWNTMPNSVKTGAKVVGGAAGTIGVVGGTVAAIKEESLVHGAISGVKAPFKVAKGTYNFGAKLGNTALEKFVGSRLFPVLSDKKSFYKQKIENFDKFTPAEKAEWVKDIIAEKQGNGVSEYTAEEAALFNKVAQDKEAFKLIKKDASIRESFGKVREQYTSGITVEGGAAKLSDPLAKIMADVEAAAGAEKAKHIRETLEYFKSKGSGPEFDFYQALMKGDKNAIARAEEVFKVYNPATPGQKFSHLTDELLEPASESVATMAPEGEVLATMTKGSSLLSKAGTVGRMAVKTLKFVSPLVVVYGVKSLNDAKNAKDTYSKVAYGIDGATSIALGTPATVELAVTGLQTWAPAVIAGSETLGAIGTGASVATGIGTKVLFPLFVADQLAGKIAYFRDPHGGNAVTASATADLITSWAEKNQAEKSMYLARPNGSFYLASNSPLGLDYHNLKPAITYLYGYEQNRPNYLPKDFTPPASGDNFEWDEHLPVALEDKLQKALKLAQDQKNNIEQAKEIYSWRASRGLALDEEGKALIEKALNVKIDATRTDYGYIENITKQVDTYSNSLDHHIKVFAGALEEINHRQAPTEQSDQGHMWAGYKERSEHFEDKLVKYNQWQAAHPEAASVEEFAADLKAVGNIERLALRKDSKGNAKVDFEGLALSSVNFTITDPKTGNETEVTGTRAGQLDSIMNRRFTAQINDMLDRHAKGGNVQDIFAENQKLADSLGFDEMTKNAMFITTTEDLQRTLKSMRDPNNGAEADLAKDFGLPAPTETTQQPAAQPASIQPRFSMTNANSVQLLNPPLTPLKQPLADNRKQGNPLQ